MKTSPNSIQIEDSCSLLLFAEEGRMFNLLVDHVERFPEASPFLMLTILPFCAITVHDGARFARKYFGSSIPSDTEDINRLRNRTKSLSANGLSFKDYSDETATLVAELSSLMKNHTGQLGPILNAIQPETSIVYYDGLPILALYVHARYVEKKRGTGSPLLSEEEYRQIGIDIGKAAAINCVVAKSTGLIAESCKAEEFNAESRDLYFPKLLAPLANKGIRNEACFFMLSELLTQINSVEALRGSGFFSDLLYLKFQSAAMVTAVRSMKSFVNTAMSSPAEFGCTADSIKLLSSTIPRKTRKAIEKTADLRNAFVHYDFPSLVGKKECNGEPPLAILEKGIQKTVGASIEEHYAILQDSAACLSRNITEAIELPSPTNR